MGSRVPTGAPTQRSYGYEYSGGTALGSIDGDTDIDVGGQTSEFRELLVRDRSGSDIVQIETSQDVPANSVFTVIDSAYEFTVDSSSRVSAGSYQWSLPSGFGIVEGQKATVGLNLVPLLDSAVVGGNRLVLVYTEDLDSGSTPAGSAYTVNVAGSPVTVTSADVSGNTVTLTLASAAASGQTVTVSYTPGTGPVRDESGLNAPAFSNQSAEYGSDDAALSGLALVNVVGDAAIGLSPAFDTATASYTASVASGVTVVSVRPAAADSLASFRYLDESDAVITDYLIMKPGMQVALAEGSNTIQVEVTASDGEAMQTYTVVVTRAEAYPVSALASNTGRADHGNVNIGNKDKEFAQRFRTGLHDLGYDLTQVGVRVNAASLEAGETMTVYIYSVGSDNNIDQLLYTLVSPDSYTDDAVNYFQAPAGATLASNTAYFVVFEGTGDAGNDFILDYTRADAEDPGKADSAWNIGNAWRQNNVNHSARSLMISIHGSNARAAGDATGQPAIAGVPQAGQVLTAGKGTIADADGTLKANYGETGFAYAYQWIQVSESSEETDIAGATSSTYTVSSGDAGKTLKVRATFVDDAGNTETATSGAFPEYTSDMMDNSSSPPRRSRRRRPPAQPATTGVRP